MEIKLWINDKVYIDNIEPDMMLIDFVRSKGFFSVKRGCETENCGLCAEQCGFCSPGFVMNVIAMKKELHNPSEEDIKYYLAGNLCRCTGYMSQLRAIKKYLNKVKED